MENNINNNEEKEENQEDEILKKASFFKAHKKIIIIISILVALGALIAGSIIYKATRPTVFNTVKAQKGTINQEVSVTGRVKPAESVDLAFESAGKVAAVYVKVGSKVSKGQQLASLSNGVLAAQLSQAKANLDAEKAKLAELQKGTRKEEITKAETALQNAKTQAAADLKQDYDAALTAVQEAAVDGKNALLTISDIQFSYFTGGDQDALNISGKKKEAVRILLGQDNSGSLASEEISKLNGGAFGLVQTAVTTGAYSDIDKALTETLKGLQAIKATLDIIPIKTSFSATEKTNISTEKNTVGAAITTVSAKEQAIAVQKVTNANAIKVAEDDLALKKAGSTPEAITAQEAKVKSVEASVKDIQAKIAKTIISAPINGVITKQDAKVGEIVSANTNLVSLISTSNFEMEVFIPEVDISKVTLGDNADVTLDAYGNDVLFNATVVTIEPAETVIEGVATYKTILQFDKEDNRIKSGMTANIDIMTEKLDNVIYIPARAVYTKNGGKYVKIVKDAEEFEVEVKTGIRGSQGNIEIKSGINEGDEVII